MRIQKLGKKLLIFACVASVVGGVGLVHYEKVKQSQSEARNDFVRQNTCEYGIGQTCPLSSEDDEKGNEFSYAAVFHWEGEIDATLLSAQYCDSLEAIEVDPQKMIKLPDFGQGDRLLVCNMRLNNINANYPSGRNYFNIDTFQLIVRDVEGLPDRLDVPLAYFDGSANPDDRRRLLEFKLEPGQEKEFIMAYVIPKNYEGKTLYYSFGTTGVDKYLVRLEQTVV